jgi:hypothetical protein
MSRSFAVLALTLGLGAVLLAADPPRTRRPVRVTVRDEQPQVQLVDLPVDPLPRIRYAFTQPNMRVGFEVLVGQGFVNITCSNTGGTSNTMCRIDGTDVEYGSPAGKWDPQQAPLVAGEGGRKRQGTRSTWVYNNLRITQIVEIVPAKLPGEKAGGKRLRSACLLRYVIENKDTKSHKVGIRNMVDTLVAGNDGAPFAIPGKNQISPGADLRSPKEIPEYVMVMQNPDLRNPGVVAHITPRPGGRLDPPNRLILTRWPGSGCGWEIPAVQAVGDTAYGIYWDPKEVPPQGKREVGFAYGRGVVSGVGDEGRVAVALGGSFEPGRLFTVSAYVEDPFEGQSLTLELPAGLSRVEGKATQPVPAPMRGGLSLVMWKARVEKAGQFALKVRSSSGVTQTKTLIITPTEDTPAPGTGRAPERNPSITPAARPSRDR